MKHDRVDRLLQLAYLEQNITTRGAYERSVLRGKPRHTVEASAETSLEEKLVSTLEGQGVHGKVVPVTVGAFLKALRTQQELRPQELFSRMGVSQNIYRLLEYDRISPLKLPVESWKKFRRLFDLPAETLIEMIRRTHQVVFFRPSLQTTLARYDARKNRAMKKEALSQATEELYLRANLKLPSHEQQKLDTLLNAISDAE